MTEVLLHTVSKIGCSLAQETTKAVIAKLSEKVKNLKELPEKAEEIGNEFKTMSNVIKLISTRSLTNEVIKGWIGEVRELAHRVEDVMHKYSYYALKLEEENIMMKFLSKGYYVTVFSEIAEEIIQIERKIQNVVKRRDRWLNLPEIISNPLADIERKPSQCCFQEVPHDDLVGIEDNRQLTEWLYSDKQGITVITVSGMGGLGKTTLVANVYEREKANFTADAWIVVSHTYDVVELLRKMLRKVTKVEYPEVSPLTELDTHDLKVKIKEKLSGGKCLLVLDDVWNREAYTQIADAFLNLQESSIVIVITTRQESVAALAQPRRQLKLKPLGHNDAFNLFCRKAFNSRMECKCPQDLEKLANNMVDRCQGLPLAIVTIGGMLSSLSEIN